MSALFDDLHRLMPFAIVATSFVGSGHCVAMCGGIALAQAQNPEAQSSYHIGRLVAYAAWGAAAGASGQALLSSGAERTLSWISAILIAIALIAAGVHMWQGRPSHFKLVPTPVLQRLLRGAGHRPLLLGLSTGLFPCGWLHAFVLAAATTRSPVQGALLLALFWLGTVPALVIAPGLARHALKRIGARSPRMLKTTAALLIALGLASLGARWTLAVPNGRVGETQCHGDARER